MSNTIIITPLHIVNGLHEVHIKRPMRTEINKMTPARLREEIEAARIYCEYKKYQLIINFTGSTELPKPNEELEEFE